MCPYIDADCYCSKINDTCSQSDCINCEIYKEKKWRFEIITDKNLDNKEIKLFCILNLLHEEEISLHKAHELCTEAGLFSDHWMVIDAQATEIWGNYYKG
jgi:hypothetical protein